MLRRNTIFIKRRSLLHDVDFDFGKSKGDSNIKRINTFIKSKGRDDIDQRERQKGEINVNIAIGVSTAEK